MLWRFLLLTTCSGARINVNPGFFFVFFLIFAVTSHHFVGPLVLSVSDFGWLHPWVLKPGWMHHGLCLMSLVYNVNPGFWHTCSIRTITVLHKTSPLTNLHLPRCADKSHILLNFYKFFAYFLCELPGLHCTFNFFYFREVFCMVKTAMWSEVKILTFKRKYW